MLQSIRDRTHGWIAGIIISLLIFSFALWGIHSYLMGGGNNSVIAEVNGVDISKAQLAVAYERLRRQLQMQYSANYEVPQQAETDIKNRALQTLINIQVLKQASIEQKYRISPRQIDGYLGSMPEFQVDGRFSVERFNQVLSTTLFNTKDFVELIDTSLLIDQPRLGLIFTSFALPNEINSTMALVGQERNIQYAVLPPVKQSVSISDEKIKAYYDAHEEEFKTPEQVSIQYIEFSLKDLMSTAAISDQQLKNYYSENVNSYSQPAQWKLETLLVPVADNATQDEVAQAHKLAEDVAKNKGAADKASSDLQGWVNADKVPVELQKALTGLTKAGQISAPIVAKNGFIIFKVQAYKEAQVQPFDQVKEKVKETLLHQQAQEKFSNLKEKLANITFEHPESLDLAAKELGLPIKTTDLFSKDKGNKDITANTKIREAAFSNDVLNLQNNSDVIQLNPDSVLVLRVKSHVPVALLSLKSVEKQIIDKLAAIEVDANTAQLADTVKSKLQSGASLAEISNEYHLNWNTLGFIGRHSNKVDGAILNSAFQLPQPQGDKKIIYGTTKVPSGYAIIALSGVQSASNNSHEQYQVFAEQIQNTDGLLEYELYKQSLMDHAKIVIKNN